MRNLGVFWLEKFDWEIAEILIRELIKIILNIIILKIILNNIIYIIK